MARIILLLVFFALLAFDAYVVVVSGYLSIFLDPFLKLSTTQVFLDLVIALGLINVGIYIDWRRRGRPMSLYWVIPVASILLGMLAPLLYLILVAYEQRPIAED